MLDTLGRFSARYESFLGEVLYRVRLRLALGSVKRLRPLGLRGVSGGRYQRVLRAACRSRPPAGP
jgi:hypothetical protein